MLGIVDYGWGNVGAIQRLATMAGVESLVLSDADQLKTSDHLLLPGVGAFDPIADSLDQSGLRPAILEAAGRGIPILGICAGMQILADASDEGESHGLGLVPGKVRRFEPERISGPAKVPHMGWNQVEPSGTHPILDGIDPELGFYFLHSFFFDCASPTDVIASTVHGDSFHSVVGRDNVIGVQFHPEKSHGNGVRLLQNFELMK